jgi:diguanylate cyclase (GGDEF)-like protein/PAS domain S-box-containing protein
MGKYEQEARLEEVVALRARVAEHEDLMRALHAGEVDALFLGDGENCRTLTIGEAGSTYRMLVEAMSEGAAIVQQDGTLLYCNRRLASMLERPLEAVIGASLLGVVTPSERADAAHLLANGLTRPGSRELTMQKQTGGFTPVQWSVSPLELGNGAAGVCVVATDLTERYRVQEALRSLSLHDELTGLFNRRGFITHAEQQLKLARRIDGQLLLVFADLDGLKQINDEQGHQAGDDAIRDAADVLRLSFRESDILARLGGDEFAVLATGTEGNAIEVIHQRLRGCIDAHNLRGTRPYRLSLSVGIIPYDPSHPVPVSELLTRADAAMYANKRAKRRIEASDGCLAIPIEEACPGIPTGASERAETPLTGVWEWTCDDNRVRWSPEMREVLGITGVEGNLSSFMAVLHADDRKRVMLEAQRALAARRSFATRFRVLTGDGRVRVVASRAHGEYGADGRVRRLLGTITDMSAFSAARDLAQATLDSMPANICVLDDESRILAVNRGWREFLKTNGASDLADQVGVRYLDICAADDGPHAELSRRFAVGLADVISGRKASFEQEYPCHSPEMQRWFVASAVRFELAGETRVMVRHQEVTAAVLLEDCLSATLRSVEAPAQQSRDGLFIVQDERVVFVNHVCAQMLSITADQLLGLRFADLMGKGKGSPWRARLPTGEGAHRRRSERRMLLRPTGGAAIEVTATVTPTLYNCQPALLGTLHSARQYLD